ncbi:hypothetical protein [Bacillus cereus]|uniref:hypothetical protein n=1 Tax=Bacillus cereus TaxID=1396 RepID=UPI0015967115|nr:hypothetical protein [Bacillus cereus]
MPIRSVAIYSVEVIGKYDLNRLIRDKDLSWFIGKIDDSKYIVLGELGLHACTEIIKT